MGLPSKVRNFQPLSRGTTFITSLALLIIWPPMAWPRGQYRPSKMPLRRTLVVSPSMLRFVNFCSAIAITPHSTTSVPPAELLLGCRPHSQLDLLHPNIARQVWKSRQIRNGTMMSVAAHEHYLRISLS